MISSRTVDSRQFTISIQRGVTAGKGFEEGRDAGAFTCAIHSLTRMYQCQPVGIEGPEGHVRPHVRVHQAGSDHQGKQDHQERVRGRAVERVKQTRVGESMVGLVGCLVQPRVPLVLHHVHRELHEVLE